MDPERPGRNKGVKRPVLQFYSVNVSIVSYTCCWLVKNNTLGPFLQQKINAVQQNKNYKGGEMHAYESIIFLVCD